MRILEWETETMGRLIEVLVCKFDELGERGKERARSWYRDYGDCWGWASEWWNSAQAFAKIAPISIERADYDRRHVSIKWTDDEAVAELTGIRAWKWLNNNGWFDWARKQRLGACSMTGFCGDAPFGDALKEYEAHPSHVPDLRQVFYEMAQFWICAAVNDCEHANSDEAIDEMLRINDYEFTTDGEFYA